MMKNIILILTLIITPIFGSKYVTIELKAGYFYKDVKIESISEDSIVIINGADKIEILNSDIQGIIVQKEKIIIKTIITGALMGYVYGFSRISNEPGSGAYRFELFLINITGLMGAGIGALVGYYSDHEKYIDFSKYSTQKRNETLRMIYNKYGISSTSTP